MPYVRKWILSLICCGGPRLVCICKVPSSLFLFYVGINPNLKKTHFKLVHFCQFYFRNSIFKLMWLENVEFKQINACWWASSSKTKHDFQIIQILTSRLHMSNTFCWLQWIYSTILFWWTISPDTFYRLRTTRSLVVKYVSVFHFWTCLRSQFQSCPYRNEGRKSLYSSDMKLKMLIIHR